VFDVIFISMKTRNFKIIIIVNCEAALFQLTMSP